MNDFIQFIMENYALEVLGLLSTIIFGCIGFIVKRFADNETVIRLARVVVNCVEQVYYSFDGPAKLEKAMETLSALLKKKHINLSRDDMKVFLESAVAEMNRVIKTPLTDAATADATRRVDEAAAADDTVQEIVKSVHEILGDTNDRVISDAAYDKGVNEGTM